MKMSDEGRRVLTELEGKRNRAYKDAVGLLTIGVGHLLTKSELTSGKIWIDGEPIRWGAGLTDEQVDALLAQDLTDTETVVEKTTTLSQSRFDACVSFAFNVGNNAFLKSNLLRQIHAQNLDAVPAQFRRWVYAGGRRIEGLARRREREIRMWNGDYS